MPKMIIGLGNPGPKYVNNRHNAGFLALDYYAKRHNAALGTVKKDAVLGQATLQKRSYAGQDIHTITHKLHLVKPMSFMNKSGIPAVRLASYFKIPPEDILVIYDDLDLPFGKLRLRSEGGAGGHNGIKSLIAQLGRHDFARLRVGVDRPPGQMPTAAYVLQDFNKSQQEEFIILCDTIADAIDTWVFQGIDHTMNRFN